MTPDQHYLNEFDPFAAEWLRGLMRDGQIPAATVDERSIKDVKATDLLGYKQCHFFAGIGGWPLAFKLAGIEHLRSAWSGSCPCQPFSPAGKGEGQADPRHLWPVWFPLIRECRPEYVFGEQVSAAIGHGWLDGVFTDMEGAGYTGGAVVLGAHSVKSPHIRQRVWWGFKRNGGIQHAESNGRDARRAESSGGSIASGCSGLRDPWSDYTIGHYRDGKARRIGRGVQPLAYGVPYRKSDPRMGYLISRLRGMGHSAKSARAIIKRAAANRTGRLKGYGNAICPQLAAVFIRSFLESVQELS